MSAIPGRTRRGLLGSGRTPIVDTRVLVAPSATWFPVVVDPADVASRPVLGLVFGLFLVESVTAVTDGYEWVGRVSPRSYYDPTGVLVRGTSDLAGAGVLLVATGALLATACWLFRRGDLARLTVTPSATSGRHGRGRGGPRGPSRPATTGG